MKITLLLLLISVSTIFPQSLEDKIGQMIMVGFSPNTEFEDTLYYDLQNRNLGGVVLFAYNIDSPSQISDQTALLNDAAATPLLIATDQEGGYCCSS